MPTLLVGSRKGLLVFEGAGRALKPVALHFAGDPVSQVLADPRDGAWYAALRMGHFGVKLRKSTDRGASWQELAPPAFPPKPDPVPGEAEDKMPWTVDMIWSLEAGGPGEPGTLWAGCLPAGLFKSEDGGASWALNRPLWDDPRRQGWLGGGYDHAGIHSVLVDPRDAKHLTLAISCGGVWQTRDGGLSWSATAAGMRANYMPPALADDPNIQDPHRLVHCESAPDALWVQHHSGVFKSSDGGLHWQAVPAAQPSAFGFAVVCDPADPQRAWFVPAQADACRIPVGGKVVVSRTDDGGASFHVFDRGLPSDNAYHLAYRHGLAISADGLTLAMASTTGGLWASDDAGASWQSVSNDLPPVAVVRFVH